MVTRLRVLRSLSLLAGLVALAVVGWRYPVIEFVTGVRWEEGRWPVVLLVLLGLYLVRPFLLWPLSLLSILVGFAFGFPYGVPLVLGGTLLSSLPPFLVASRYEGEFPRLGWVADRGSELVDTTGEFRGMVAARLSPAPADAVSYGAGIARVSTGAFAAGTVVGELPWAVLYVLLGESLRTVSGETLPSLDLRLVLLAALGSVLLVARPVYGYLRGRVREGDGRVR